MAANPTPQHALDDVPADADDYAGEEVDDD